MYSLIVAVAVLFIFDLTLVLSTNVIKMQMKEVGVRYKALDDDEKAKWTAKADKLKEEYKVELAKYEKSKPVESEKKSSSKKKKPEPKPESSDSEDSGSYASSSDSDSDSD